MSWVGLCTVANDCSLRVIYLALRVLLNQYIKVCILHCLALFMETLLETTASGPLTSTKWNAMLKDSY